MGKIEFNKFKTIMNYDIIKYCACIEINFSIEESEKYQSCWLGKKFDCDENRIVYWFGLTEDGLNAYDFDNAEQMFGSRVFDGKNIVDMWNRIQLLTINGCDFDDKILHYFEDKMEPPNILEKL